MVVSEIKIAPKHTDKVLSSIHKQEKAMMHLTEKKHVPISFTQV
jgi:hypothetical protein